MSFQKFLTNVDGNFRNEKVAREIAMDVSKYIKFACGSTPIPNWERLLNRDMVIVFIDKCKHFKLEADGQIRKLDLLEAGLTFIRRRILKDDPNLPARHPGSESTMDISWQVTMVIIVQCLRVWTTLHSQCQAVQQTQMEHYSTMLKLSAMEFPVHHMTHRKKLCV